jgi:hypothetical protein
MLLTAHILQKEGCDKMQWVYQLATVTAGKKGCPVILILIFYILYF